MREVTKLMVNDFKIMRLGYDFMGYEVKREKDLSFHHTIIPHRRCAIERIPNEGYVYWNGAILVQSTSHDYLHLIEAQDYDMFCELTSELIDINMKRRIDHSNLHTIDDLLTSFEREYCGKSNGKGKQLIKEQYTRRLKF